MASQKKATLDSVEWWSHQATRVLAIIGGAVLWSMSIAVTADVVGRYCFNNPIKGVTEYCELGMPAAIFAGMAYTAAVGAHIRVTVLTSRSKGRWKLFLDALAFFIGALFFGLLAWKTGENAIFATQTREMLGVTGHMSTPPTKFIIAIGSGLACLQFLLSMVSCFCKAKRTA